ncbi:MAG: PQQ-dependent sugar dehydrogenase [Burkholderiales bacterium]|nr:PQQ-dependent sugar dehydrogenase [Opitutaceae bacterium]
MNPRRPSPFARRLRFSGLLLFAIVAAVSARAQTEELTRDTAKLYAQFCASCHGEKLDGGLGGSLVDGVWKHGDGGDEHLARMITAGLPQLGMPGFGETLDAPRVRGLVVFMRERATRAEESRTTPAKPDSANTVVRSRAANFRVENVIDKDLGVPWSLGFLPGDEGVLIAQRDGKLRLARGGKLLPEPIAGTPRVWAEGQGGLMVVQAHPDYAKPGNGWIYLAFSDPGEREGEAMTAVVRGRIRDGRWTDEQQIYRAPRELYRRAGVHFGTRLVFDQGYLFFGIGDRGAQTQAQELGRPNGKMHRVHDDGRVPTDNPFAGNPDALPTIWSFGHRNPQGIVARPGTTGATLQIWETEHGPRGGDELNLIKRGANFGWPLITHGMNYNGTPLTAETARDGLEQPAVHWTPSIAVCGLDFYSGERFPAWKGNLLVGALGKQELRRVVLEGDVVKEQEVLFRGIGRVRSVHTGPDGLVYVCLENPGRVVRLVPVE